MPLSRQQKEELVAAYQEELVRAPHVFLMSFEGISAPQATELRHRVRESGGSYIVVKNRLVLRALEGAALAGLGEKFVGATAAVYTERDAVSLAKALTDFAKDAPVLEFKGGLVDGREVTGEQIREIASLPSREELTAKLLFLLQSPVVRFARALDEIQRQFVVVLDQVRQAKEKQS